MSFHVGIVKQREGEKRGRKIEKKKGEN